MTNIWVSRNKNPSGKIFDDRVNQLYVKLAHIPDNRVLPLFEHIDSNYQTIPSDYEIVIAYRSKFGHETPEPTSNTALPSPGTDTASLKDLKKNNPGYESVFDAIIKNPAGETSEIRDVALRALKNYGGAMPDRKV